MEDVDLSELSFFEGWEPTSVSKVAKIGEPVEVEAGAVIMDQGDVGQEAFVVQEGEVEIVVNGQPVATVGRGALLGEMALLEKRPRSARIVAVTDCRLASFDSAGFKRILGEMPDAERQRLAEVDAKFRVQNDEIARGDKPRPITG